MKQIYKKARFVLVALLLVFALGACDASVSLDTQSASSYYIQ